MKKVIMAVAAMYVALVAVTISCNSGVGESHYIFNRSPLVQVP